MSHTTTPTRTLAGTLLHYQYSTLMRYRWIERFYILHDQLLFIVNQQQQSSSGGGSVSVPLSIEDAIKHPSTVIWLSDCYIVQQPNNEYAGKKHCFMLTNKIPASTQNNNSNNSNSTDSNINKNTQQTASTSASTGSSNVSSMFNTITSTVYGTAAAAPSTS